MTDFRIWSVIIALSAITYLLRASFILFMGHRELPEAARRYLRYVAVAIIPGMIAGLIAFPASLGGTTSASWLGATLVAVLVGMKWKNSLVIMLAGAAAYILLELFI